MQATCKQHASEKEVKKHEGRDDKRKSNASKGEKRQ